MLVRLQASAGLVASQLARPREPLRGPALGVRTGLVRRPRAGHVVSCDVGSTGLPGVLGVRGGCTDLPGVLGVLVAALAMSVLPAGNAAPVVPCGAALAAPGATVGGDVSWGTDILTVDSRSWLSTVQVFPTVLLVTT